MAIGLAVSLSAGIVASIGHNRIVHMTAASLFFILLVIHLVINRKWIAKMLGSVAKGKFNKKQRYVAILNTLLFVAAVVLLFSGVVMAVAPYGSGNSAHQGQGYYENRDERADYYSDGEPKESQREYNNDRKDRAREYSNREYSNRESSRLDDRERSREDMREGYGQRHDGRGGQEGHRFGSNQAAHSITAFTFIILIILHIKAYWRRLAGYLPRSSRQ